MGLASISDRNRKWPLCAYNAALEGVWKNWKYTPAALEHKQFLSSPNYIASLRSHWSKCPVISQIGKHLVPCTVGQNRTSIELFYTTVACVATVSVGFSARSVFFGRARFCPNFRRAKKKTENASTVREDQRKRLLHRFLTSEITNWVYLVI